MVKSYGWQWAVWWKLWTRCSAKKEPNSSGYWGRCELVKNHKTPHALDRGMEVLTWSTDWNHW